MRVMLFGVRVGRDLIRAPACSMTTFGNRKRVDDRIRSAIHQARSKGLPAIAAVCLDAILNVRAESRRPIAWLASSAKEGLDGGFDRFRDVLVDAVPRVQSRTDPSLLGIAWIGRVPVIVPEEAKEGLSYSGNAYGYMSVNGELDEQIKAPLRRFAAVLLEGLP